MSKVTQSDVNVAVNKAYAAGLAGQAYEGLMPSAHDAGVHYRQSNPDPSDSGQAYLTLMLKAADDGFEKGSWSGDSFSGSTLYTPSGYEGLTGLSLQDAQAVYNEGYAAGYASGHTNWTPWLIGAGAVAVLGIGAVVLTRKKNSDYASNPGGKHYRLVVTLPKSDDDALNGLEKKIGRANSDSTHSSSKPWEVSWVFVQKPTADRALMAAYTWRNMQPTKNKIASHMKAEIRVEDWSK